MLGTHRLSLLLGLMAAAASLSLAGCAGAPPPPIADFGSATPNPIQISRTRLAHLVTFPQGGASLEGSQGPALFNFIATQGVGPKDTLLVEHGAASAELARAESIASSLAGIGLRPTIVGDASLAGGVIRVVVERYVAIAPDCPNWSAEPGPNFENYDQKNFGCAEAKNLAAMVADPKDLAMGAALPAQVGDPVTRPEFTYRSARPNTTLGGGASGAGAGAGAGGAMGGSAPGGGGAMGGATGGAASGMGGP
jgi:pilus biogenesis lipoprotein CpaD